MGHRTQITLDDAQYERLLAESRASGVSLAELIRRAVDRSYAGPNVEEFTAALDHSFGAWESAASRDRSGHERVSDGEEYVESIRPARPDRFSQ